MSGVIDSSRLSSTPLWFMGQHLIHSDARENT
jgi:hypothetical protein